MFPISCNLFLLDRASLTKPLVGEDLPEADVYADLGSLRTLHRSAIDTERLLRLLHPSTSLSSEEGVMDEERDDSGDLSPLGEEVGFDVEG